jgi:hypothetical protein
LLCSSISVDTQKKERLCCAAAGITALPNSATEALIPYEKLREAATYDETLIAQNHPPAQPLMEGKTTNDLFQKVQAERISIIWEYEGGCHVWRYRDNDEPCEKAYGNTIQEALEKLETQND